MKRLHVVNTPITALKIVERQALGDSRGFLSRLFCAEELTDAGWHKPIAQINHTLTQVRGTVRGLHFQRSPCEEMKLVTCLHGSVWDVAVDLRADSPTFLYWHAEELSASNQRAMLIPEGFAHGFQTLCDDCELIYLHSAIYSSGAEGGFNALDTTISIRWPLTVTEMSSRDKQLPMLDTQFKGLML